MTLCKSKSSTIQRQHDFELLWDYVYQTHWIGEGSNIDRQPGDSWFYALFCAMIEVKDNGQMAKSST
jgi:hypothetical protein